MINVWWDSTHCPGKQALTMMLMFAKVSMFVCFPDIKRYSNYTSFFCQYIYNLIHFRFYIIPLSRFIVFNFNIIFLPPLPSLVVSLSLLFSLLLLSSLIMASPLLSHHGLSSPLSLWPLLSFSHHGLSFPPLIMASPLLSHHGLSSPSLIPLPF